MRPLIWLALIALTACAEPNAGPTAPDPEPDPQPEAPAEPDPTPDPQPTPEPTPEPEPQPDPDPEPEPTPDPEPGMSSPLDTALANAAEACEDACATYAGDACLGDGFPADQCADFCDYPTIFTNNFDHFDEITALGCVEAFTVLDACIAALSCEDVQLYLAADPEGDEDYPCKPKDDALAMACPPEGERMFSPEMQTAFASAEDACVTACAAYAGDACLGDDLPLQDCLAFCPYADILPERFPGLDNDALACVESFETLELCLTDLSCEDVRLYFALDPEGFPCQTEDEAIATTCAPFEQP